MRASPSSHLLRSEKKPDLRANLGSFNKKRASVVWFPKARAFHCLLPTVQLRIFTCFRTMERKIRPVHTSLPPAFTVIMIFSGKSMANVGKKAAPFPERLTAFALKMGHHPDGPDMSAATIRLIAVRVNLHLWETKTPTSEGRGQTCSKVGEFARL
jgi:hypothetical protein